MATTTNAATDPADRPGVARAHGALARVTLLWGLVQFFLAGLAAFGGTSWDPHAASGTIMTLLTLIVLILAAVGRRSALQASLVLFGLMIVQNILGGVGDDVPVLGALHPLNGMAILGTAALAAAGRPVRFGRAAHAVR
jgi:hypothetical protein